MQNRRLKWFDDKYLVFAVAAVIVIMLNIVLILVNTNPTCKICGCVRYAKDCHSFCKPYGREMSVVCQHICVRPH